jgi:hypothetical protein
MRPICPRILPIMRKHGVVGTGYGRAAGPWPWTVAAALALAIVARWRSSTATWHCALSMRLNQTPPRPPAHARKNTGGDTMAGQESR